jgi:hypothetical protein
VARLFGYDAPMLRRVAVAAIVALACVPGLAQNVDAKVEEDAPDESEVAGEAAQEPESVSDGEAETDDNEQTAEAAPGTDDDGAAEHVADIMLEPLKGTPVWLELADGDAKTGTLLTFDAASIVLQKDDGEVVLVKRAEVQRLMRVMDGTEEAAPSEPSASREADEGEKTDEGQPSTQVRTEFPLRIQKKLAGRWLTVTRHDGSQVVGRVESISGSLMTLERTDGSGVAVRPQEVKSLEFAQVRKKAKPKAKRRSVREENRVDRSALAKADSLRNRADELDDDAFWELLVGGALLGWCGVATVGNLATAAWWVLVLGTATTPAWIGFICGACAVVACCGGGGAYLLFQSRQDSSKAEQYRIDAQRSERMAY